MTKPEKQTAPKAKAGDKSKAKAADQSEAKAKAKAPAPAEVAPPANVEAKSPAKVEVQPPEEKREPRVLPVKPEKLPSIAFVRVPVQMVQAALACVSSEEQRDYLKGVYVHRHADVLRMVGTDGHRLLVASYKPEKDAELPEWLAEGVTVPSDGLKPMLGLIRKMGSKYIEPFVRIGFGRGAPKMILEDEFNFATFRVEPVDGKFPDYTRVIDASIDPDEVRGDFEPLGFNSQYLKHVGEVAKILDCKAVGLYQGQGSNPSILTFPEKPGVVMYLMPMTVDPVMAKENVAILEPAIRGSLAALRAHVTRNVDAAKESSDPVQKASYLEKAEGFKARIAALLKRADPTKALPKPERQAEGQAPAQEPPAAPKAPAPAPAAPAPKPEAKTPASDKPAAAAPKANGPAGDKPMAKGPAAPAPAPTTGPAAGKEPRTQREAKREAAKARKGRGVSASGRSAMPKAKRKVNGARVAAHA